MGVVLGITAHGRTQEKINGVDAPAAPAVPGIGGMMGSFMPAPAAAPSFAPPAPSFPAANFAPQQPAAAPVESGRFGKIMPVAEDPIL